MMLPRRRLLLAFVAALAGRGVLAGATAAPAGLSPLRTLAERHFDALLDANPLWASQLGLATPQQAARIAITIAPAYRARMQAIDRRTLAQLERIDRRQLDEADGITYDVLCHRLQDSLASARFP